MTVVVSAELRCGRRGREGAVTVSQEAAAAAAACEHAHDKQVSQAAQPPDSTRMTSSPRPLATGRHRDFDLRAEEDGVVEHAAHGGGADEEDPERRVAPVGKTGAPEARRPAGAGTQRVDGAGGERERVRA